MLNSLPDVTEFSGIIENVERLVNDIEFLINADDANLFIEILKHLSTFAKYRTISFKIAMGLLKKINTTPDKNETFKSIETAIYSILTNILDAINNSVGSDKLEDFVIEIYNILSKGREYLNVKVFTVQLRSFLANLEKFFSKKEFRSNLAELLESLGELSKWLELSSTVKNTIKYYQKESIEQEKFYYLQDRSNEKYKKSFQNLNLEDLDKIYFCSHNRKIEGKKFHFIKWNNTFANEQTKKVKELADDGMRIAMWEVGECFNSGYGVKKDEEKSLQWYFRAAIDAIPKGVFYNLAEKRFLKSTDNEAKVYLYLLTGDPEHKQQLNNILLEKLLPDIGTEILERAYVNISCKRTLVTRILEVYSQAKEKPESVSRFEEQFQGLLPDSNAPTESKKVGESTEAIAENITPISEPNPSTENKQVSESTDNSNQGTTAKDAVSTNDADKSHNDDSPSSDDKYNDALYKYWDSRGIFNPEKSQEVSVSTNDSSNTPKDNKSYYPQTVLQSLELNIPVVDPSNLRQETLTAIQNLTQSNNLTSSTHSSESKETIENTIQDETMPQNTQELERQSELEVRNKQLEQESAELKEKVRSFEKQAAKMQEQLQNLQQQVSQSAKTPAPSISISVEAMQQFAGLIQNMVKQEVSHQTTNKDNYSDAKRIKNYGRYFKDDTSQTSQRTRKYVSMTVESKKQNDGTETKRFNFSRPIRIRR
jgi:hypothetical protein